MTGAQKTQNYNDGDNIGGSCMLLFHDAVRAFRPQGFEDMEAVQAAARYPYNDSPEVIWTGGTGRILVTFRLYPKPLKSGQSGAAAKGIAALIRKVYPSNHDIAIADYLTNQGVSGSTFSFQYCSGGARQYGEFFVLPVRGCLFTGTACCPEEERHRWKAAFKAIRTGSGEAESSSKNGINRMNRM